MDLMKDRDEMFSELVDGLLSLMRDQVVSIILYGSVARGTDMPESDIDIVLITRSGLDTDTDRALSALVAEMDLKHSVVFSVVDIEESFFLKWRKAMPFCRNIEEQGIVLWKAA